MTAIRRIKVGTGSCGIASGAGELFTFLSNEIKDIPVVEVGCIGHCYAEPLVEVETDSGSVFYEKAAPKKEFIDVLRNLGNTSRFTIRAERSTRELLKVTRLAGRISPVSIDEYIAEGGYTALTKVRSMEPAAVVQEITKSNLRGRGGGGFKTGLKWSFLAAKKDTEKVIICNADEGDPGAFMDRSMMESVPHQVLEGMLIAAHATGANKLVIYCRAEYPLALQNLKIAITDISARRINISTTGDVIPVILKEGAGAFVCGEETAMIHSLEGHRGTPRFRPPYPTDSGLHGLPTMINNVETFANVPIIITEGVDAYTAVGTKGSSGTKLFALAGDVAFPGLVEVPMGITIGEIVYEIGGAPQGSVKAVQIGGPSGGCIPEEHFDTPVDYDSLKKLGAMMGSGGLIAIGKNRCMVETARYFLDFTARESCGKCTFCRIGTTRMLERLEKITAGKATADDIAFLEDIGPRINKCSLCGLGQTAPNPVISTLRYFRHEYESHVIDKSCPTLNCNALTNVAIDLAKCVKCGLCIKSCPVKAISKEFVVDNMLCTRCNGCIDICPKDAANRVPRETEKKG